MMSCQQLDHIDGSKDRGHPREASVQRTAPCAAGAAADHVSFEVMRRRRMRADVHRTSIGRNHEIAVRAAVPGAESTRQRGKSLSRDLCTI